MGGSGLAEGEVLNSGVYSTEDSLGGGGTLHCCCPVHKKTLCPAAAAAASVQARLKVGQPGNNTWAELGAKHWTVKLTPKTKVCWG